MKKREGFQLLSMVISYIFHKAYLSFLPAKFHYHACICLCGQPEFVNVCFWFIPPSLRGKEGTEDYQEKLAKVSLSVAE